LRPAQPDKAALAINIIMNDAAFRKVDFIMGSFRDAEWSADVLRKKLPVEMPHLRIHAINRRAKID
jgi:hypothetical protein